MNKSPLLIYIFLFLKLSYSQNFTIKKDSIDRILTQSFIEINNGENDVALAKQEFVVAWSKFHENDSTLAQAYNLIAGNYFILEDYKAAETYLNRALKFAEKTNYKKTLIQIYSNYHGIHLNKSDYKQAIEYLQLALEISNDPSIENDSKVWTVYNLARTYFKAGNMGEAKKYYSLVIAYFVPNSRHQPELLVKAYLDLGKIALLHKEYKNAISKLKVADSLAQKIENYEILASIEDNRYAIYSQTKETPKAIEALKKNLSYLQKQINTKNESLEKSYTLKQHILDQQKSLEVKDQTYEIQEDKLKLSQIFSIFLTTLSIGIVIIAFLLYRSNSKNKQLNKGLTKKNKELLDSKQKMEYAAKLKTNFFSTISHELRTPLYAVKGITDILLDENPKREQKNHLKILKNSGEYLLALINNILQINKFDEQGITHNEVIFGFNELIESTKQALNYLKKENNNTITVDIVDNLPNLLKGDALKLSQIINNLVSNSLKFTRNGEVIIHAEIINDFPDYIELKISVIDNGIGISKEMQENIFNDFYQESMKLDRNYEGIGLGLAIVKRLLKSMDSNITVLSNENQGATFSFNVKLKLVDTTEIKKITIDQFALLENSKILVVDDNKVNLVITKQVLNKKNVQVTLAHNGLEGVEKVKENDYAIILMDIHMPGMDGYEATKQIRLFDKTTPIIALTALQLEEEKIVAAGFNDVIVKPYAENLFFQKISKHLNPPNSLD